MNNPMTNLIPRTTYHAVYDDAIMDALRYARTNGFAGVQFAVDVPTLSHERLSAAQRDAVGRYREEYNLTISLRTSISLTQTSPAVLAGVFEYYKGLFQFAEDVSAAAVVLPLGTLPAFPTDTDPRLDYPPQSQTAWTANLDANLRRLINLAAMRFTLAVEPVRLARPVVDVLTPLLGDAGLSLCWDLPRTYRRAPHLPVYEDARQWEIDPAAETFFVKHLRHVRHARLHDLRGRQAHRVIGTGEVDVPRFLHRLTDANVREFTLDVRPREKALESLQNLKKLLDG